MTATDVLGERVKRVEDPRFITGGGRYLDDIKLPGMARMTIMRSPYAHANIRSIDTSAAKAMPGVIAVFTGADIPYNPLPMAWPAGGASGIRNNVNTPRVLATDSVKWTGEGVAAVIAAQRAAATAAPIRPPTIPSVRLWCARMFPMSPMSAICRALGCSWSSEWSVCIASSFDA